MQKSTPNGAIQFAYDAAGRLIGEYPGGTNGQETAWLGDMPVAVFNPSGTYYVHADYRNAPRQIDDANGKAVWSWDGLAYGGHAPNGAPGGQSTTFVYNLNRPGICRHLAAILCGKQGGFYEWQAVH